MNWYRIAQTYYSIGHRGYHSGEMGECQEALWVWDGQLHSSKVTDENMMSNHYDIFGDMPYSFKGRAEVCPKGQSRVSVSDTDTSKPFSRTPAKLYRALEQEYGSDIQIFEF